MPSPLVVIVCIVRLSGVLHKGQRQRLQLRDQSLVRVLFPSFIRQPVPSLPPIIHSTAKTFHSSWDSPGPKSQTLVSGKQIVPRIFVIKKNLPLAPAWGILGRQSVLLFISHPICSNNHCSFPTPRHFLHFPSSSYGILNDTWTSQLSSHLLFHIKNLSFSLSLFRTWTKAFILPQAIS